MGVKVTHTHLPVKKEIWSIMPVPSSTVMSYSRPGVRSERVVVESAPSTTVEVPSAAVWVMEWVVKVPSRTAEFVDTSPRVMTASAVHYRQTYQRLQTYINNLIIKIASFYTALFP